MSKSCPKCGRGMEEGVTVDAGHYDVRHAAKWHRGQPVKKWLGMRFDKAGMLTITSWRCTSCGLLENYAK